MPERAVLPKPIQKPHPPMWVAVTSPGTEIDAADRGLGCLGLTPGGFEESERKVKAYRDRVQNCDPVGEFVNDKVHTVNFLSCGGGRRPRPPSGPARREHLQLHGVAAAVGQGSAADQLLPVGRPAPRAAPGVRQPG